MTDCVMSKGLTVYSQTFIINKQEYIGEIEKHNDDTYIVIYHNGEEIKRAIYNDTNYDDFSMLCHMENLIEN